MTLFAYNKFKYKSLNIKDFDLIDKSLPDKFIVLNSQLSYNILEKYNNLVISFNVMDDLKEYFANFD